MFVLSLLVFAQVAKSAEHTIDYWQSWSNMYPTGSSKTIQAGDTVSWTWNGNHNVHWDDDDFNTKYFCGTSPCVKTFTADDIGTWTYYCSIPGHRGAGQDDYSLVIEAKPEESVVVEAESEESGVVKAEGDEESGEGNGGNGDGTGAGNGTGGGNGGGAKAG